MQAYNRSGIGEIEFLYLREDSVLESFVWVGWAIYRWKVYFSSFLEDKKYTFGIDGIDTFNTKLDYKRSLNGFDIIFSSNYKLMSHIPEYGANIELSSAF